VAFKSCDELTQAILAEVGRTGRSRVLLSGSLSPENLKQLTARLGHLDLNDPDPDPLGFENLVSMVSPDMACVVFQNPGYFGTVRDLTALVSECREWDVPLLILNSAVRAEPDDRALSLVAALRRIAGIKIVTDRFIDRFSIHLGDEVDSADILEILQKMGITSCEAVAMSYPSYPELRPVLIINAAHQNDSLIKSLRDALALNAKQR
jgi:hypothetical protein